MEGHLSLRELQLLAECERGMDSGAISFVNAPGGRLAVSQEVMDHLQLESGQTVSAYLASEIMRVTLAFVTAEADREAAKKPPRES